jgi:hypothetical protein
VAIVDIFSKRKKLLEEGGKHDVYQYDSLPQPFRVQVSLIWHAAIGPFGYQRYGLELPTNRFWRFIHKTLCKEYGVYYLGVKGADLCEQCHQHLLSADVDRALDIIELSFRVIDCGVRNLQHWEIGQTEISQGPDDAIEELNHRFREHGIGYEYADGLIIPIASQLIHAEAVKPALALLSQPGFEGPAEEFTHAFDHYRHRRYKEAVAEALKAFESTMKAICTARKWVYPPNATAKPLIDLLLSKGLIPRDLETHFGALRSAMESGLPTISNRTSRHGQGPEPRQIPPHFVAYALHLAASNIVFLVEVHKAAG